MPWKVRAGGKDCPFEVVKSDTGKRVACHPTRERALAHMRALYVHADDTGKATTMDVVTKTVDADVTPVESDNPNGEFDVILSTDALDRDGERLFIEEWRQPLPDRIHFDSDHGLSITSTVGSGHPFINDAGQLQVRGTYAKTEHAQMVRGLVNDGHVTSTSVTFRNIKTQKDSAPQRELLNGAFVAVPANPEAKVLASKAAKQNPEKSHAQMIHDVAVALGAQCGADTGEDEGANKRITEETSSTKSVGMLQESAEESAAAAAEKSAAAAAEESADDVAKEQALARGRKLAFLSKQHTEKD